MFMDAVQYSAVARNLSEGNGSIWNLQFDTYNIHNLPSFSEQPPLSFVIQSWFYSILGDSIYVERLYVFLCLIITILLLSKFWKLFMKNTNSDENQGWLPVLIWITIPIVFWSFRNNMIENTLGIFTLAASYYIIKSIKIKNNLIETGLGGIFIFLALLTKGLPALFPIAIPFIGYLIYRNTSFPKTTVTTLLLIIIPTFLLFVTTLIFPESKSALRYYFIDRAMVRIKEGDPNPSETNIINSLSQQLAIPIIITSIILTSYQLKYTSLKKQLKRHDVNFLFLIGLSASLPVLISSIQKQFYITSAYPFFAISIALMWYPGVKQLINYLNNFKYIKIAKVAIPSFVLLLTVYFTINNYGKYSRDKLILIEAEQISNILPSGTKVSVSDNIYYNWVFHCYLIRNHQIYPDNKNILEYVLIDTKNDTINTSSLKAIDSKNNRFKLYHR